MRCAGVLLPVFSLPSPRGIGSLGQAARDFLDFLARSGLSCWQVLPLGPTSFGDSPYQSFSSFAGNPYFIDLDDLCRDGLLTARDYQSLDWGREGTVDYALLYRTRYPVLRTACAQLLADPPADYAAFLEDNRFWLEDYALFMALKEEQGGRSWLQWPDGVRRREPAALAEARLRLAGDIAFWQGVQYLFYHQWDALRAIAREKGISLIGDLPIYTAPDSADIWADPHLFQVDEELIPTEVAGCPPDAYSEDGQLWGNPLFDWERMARDDYQWWRRRIAFQFRLFDTLRIDHFRGFDAYYAIPYGSANARVGRWRQGPGKAFFRALRRDLGQRSIIAEDLGFLTPSVRELLDYTGYPGMKILQFGFDSRGKDSCYLPHRCPVNAVMYTGTHDNETAAAWLDALPPEDRAYAVAYMRLNREEGFCTGMARTVWASPADLAILQMQDLLGLGAEARINTPSTLGGNWKWRLRPGQCTDELACRIRADLAVYGRIPQADGDSLSYNTSETIPGTDTGSKEL